MTSACTAPTATPSSANSPGKAPRPCAGRRSRPRRARRTKAVPTTTTITRSRRAGSPIPVQRRPSPANSPAAPTTSSGRSALPRSNHATTAPTKPTHHRCAQNVQPAPAAIEAPTPRVAAHKRQSGRSRSTGTTDQPSSHRPPTLAAAGPDKQGRPRSQTQPIRPASAGSSTTGGRPLTQNTQPPPQARTNNTASTPETQPR